MNVQLRRHNRSFNRENYTTERNETRTNKFNILNQTTQPKSMTPNRARLPGLHLNGTTPINKRSNSSLMGFEHVSKNRIPSLNHTVGELKSKTHVPSQIIDEGKQETLASDAQGGNETEEMMPSMVQIDVGKAMNMSYNQYLYHKLLEKERLKVARTKANQLEDEKRDTFRKKFLEKERKKEMVISNLLQKKEQRTKEIEAQRKDKAQKLEELEQIYFNKSRERFKILLSKLDRSYVNKKELDMNKTMRITARNGMISSKQRARAEKEIQENSLLLTQTSLQDLENKLAINSARKKKYIDDKINRSQTYLRGVAEKGFMANQAKINKQNEYLQKFAIKMDKARSRSLMVTPKATEMNEDYHPEERTGTGFAARAELVHQRYEELEKKRLLDLKEKDRLLKERLAKRKKEIREYVNEKRDEWDFRLGVVKQNARANSVDHGDRTESRMSSYKARINNLLASRIEKRNKLEKLGTTFTFESPPSRPNLFITGTEPTKLR